jgi:hypothetical protein
MARCAPNDEANCARKKHYATLQHARSDARAMADHYGARFGIAACACCGGLVIYTVDPLDPRRRRRPARLTPARRWFWRDALAEASAQ